MLCISKSKSDNVMSIPDETKIEICLRFYVNCIGKRIPSFTNNIENTALSVKQFLQ